MQKFQDMDPRSRDDIACLFIAILYFAIFCVFVLIVLIIIDAIFPGLLCPRLGTLCPLSQISYLLPALSFSAYSDKVWAVAVRLWKALIGSALIVLIVVLIVSLLLCFVVSVLYVIYADTPRAFIPALAFLPL